MTVQIKHPRILWRVQRVHVPLHLPKEFAAALRRAAADRGLSVNEFVFRLIEAEIGEA